jgi:crotonobetainyl-CoA:carnitine CoA-transferase CaiB-like acyl-CoA transferase
VVQTNRDLLCDTHLRARRAFWSISHLLGDTYPYPGPSTRLTGTPAQCHRPAPNLGEHNRQILEGLLGLSPAEIEELEVQGVIGIVVP